MLRYATKYCHSLKLHLRKYGHKPAMVLNNDGSPNPVPDPYAGGKRPKGGRKEDNFPPTLLPNLPQFPSLPPSLMQMQLQHLQSQFGHPKIGGGGLAPPFRGDDHPPFTHKLGEAANGNHSPPAAFEEQTMRCDKCEFSTSSKEVFRNHMMLHASTERGALHQLLTSPLQHAATKRSLSELNKSTEELHQYPSPRMRSSSPSLPSSPFGLLHGEKADSPTAASSSLLIFRSSRSWLTSWEDFTTSSSSSSSEEGNSLLAA